MAASLASGGRSGLVRGARTRSRGVSRTSRSRSTLRPCKGLHRRLCEVCAVTSCALAHRATHAEARDPSFTCDGRATPVAPWSRPARRIAAGPPPAFPPLRAARRAARGRRSRRGAVGRVRRGACSSSSAAASGAVLHTPLGSAPTAAGDAAASAGAARTDASRRRNSRRASGVSLRRRSGRRHRARKRRAAACLRGRRSPPPPGPWAAPRRDRSVGPAPRQRTEGRAKQRSARRRPPPPPPPRATAAAACGWRSPQRRARDACGQARRRGGRRPRGGRGRRGPNRARSSAAPSRAPAARGNPETRRAAQAQQAAEEHVFAVGCPSRDGAPEGAAPRVPRVASLSPCTVREPGRRRHPCAAGTGTRGSSRASPSPFRRHCPWVRSSRCASPGPGSSMTKWTAFTAARNRQGVLSIMASGARAQRTEGVRGCEPARKAEPLDEIGEVRTVPSGRCVEHERRGRAGDGGRSRRTRRRVLAR